MNKFFLKTELIIVLFGIILSILVAQYNLNKFDKTFKNSETQNFPTSNFQRQQLEFHLNRPLT